MSQLHNIILAQLNFKAADLDANFKKIKNTLLQEEGDLYVFSELALLGYIPDDILLYEDLIHKQEEYLQEIIKISKDRNKAIIIGAIYQFSKQFFNAAYFIHNGEIKQIITKKNLPNFSVFSESRYFHIVENNNAIIELFSKKINILICEDFWQKDLKVEQKVDLTIVINASPYCKGKAKLRLDIAKNYYSKFKHSIIYVNQVGAQDGIVFDGNSFILKNNQECLFLPSFQEEVHNFRLNADFNSQKNEENQLSEIYNALLLGLRDYIQKNGFAKVVLGLSGGIDSHFCAVLCADAVGIENLTVVKLPSKFTSEQSNIDADYFINQTDCSFYDVEIEELYNLLNLKLSTIFANRAKDHTEENMQARIRGLILMSISNKFNSLLITTGNKSEYATGYCTIYGDMCGAYAPIKDIYKTELYKLANYRNNFIPKLSLFPQKNLFNNSVLSKEPTAELREGQQDSDSLPIYQILDEILQFLIEERKSSQEIVKLGYDSETVKKVAKLLKVTEHKRFQSAPGTKINKNSFNKDWRMPLTNGYDF